MAPTSGGEVVQEQLRAGHHYYNALIAIEQERRQLFRESRSKCLPNLERIEKAYEALCEEETKLREQISQRKQAAHLSGGGQKNVNTQDIQARLSVLKAQRATLKKTLQAERQEAHKNKALKTLSKEIDGSAVEKGKEAYRTAGLYWGIRGLVDKAIQAAKKSSVDPRFHSWDGEGRVGGQLHSRVYDGVKGFMTTGQLMNGGNSYIKIDPLPPNQWDTRSGCRHAHTTVHIRVGPDENPVMASFPVLIHRKPPSGVVKLAWIRIFRVGTTVKYELQLSIESNDFTEVPCGKGTVALDTGWRNLPGVGYRVAMAVDDHGRRQEFILPDSYRVARDHADALKAAGDSCFERALQVFNQWKKGPSVPKWVKKETDFSEKWRAHSRLAAVAFKLVNQMLPQERIQKLWGAWKNHCHVGARGENTDTKTDLFEMEGQILTPENFAPWLKKHGISDPNEQFVVYLEWWRRKNRHLYQYESTVREKALNRRRDLYRCWAAKLRAEYKTIVYRDVPLSAMARKSKPEDNVDPRLEAARYNRFLVAPSELMGAIVSAVGNDRVTKLKVNDACLKCGGKVFDDPTKAENTCDHCGATMDQDERVARILIREYHESFGDSRKGGVKPTKKNTSKNLDFGDKAAE
jgi:hypothetical protein